jgi:hypothetical protein
MDMGADMGGSLADAAVSSMCAAAKAGAEDLVV